MLHEEAIKVYTLPKITMSLRSVLYRNDVPYDFPATELAMIYYIPPLGEIENYTNNNEQVFLYLIKGLSLVNTPEVLKNLLFGFHTLLKILASLHFFSRVFTHREPSDVLLAGLVSEMSTLHSILVDC